MFTDTPYRVAQFVRFVAVDVAGNRSDPSAQATGMTGEVVSADIFDGAVGHEKLASLAVRTANIDLLAVNSAQVGTIISRVKRPIIGRLRISNATFAM